MVKRSKKYLAMKEKVDRYRMYDTKEAIDLAKEVAYAKFDETLEVSMNLGVDPRHADQIVRGAVVLPHGLGKEVRVLVFAKGDKEREAKEAGADYVGAEDFLEKIEGGWLDFDKVIATPDVMGMVGKLGKILGPRGLMPNPKIGTVTFEIGKAVKETKAGKIDFRVDKGGVLHAPIGKLSFDTYKLLENMYVLVDTVIRLKPASSKGVYLKNVVVSSTLGPGIKIDVNLLKSAIR